MKKIQKIVTTIIIAVGGNTAQAQWSFAPDSPSEDTSVTITDQAGTARHYTPGLFGSDLIITPRTDTPVKPGVERVYDTTSTSTGVFNLMLSLYVSQTTYDEPPPPGRMTVEITTRPVIASSMINYAYPHILSNITVLQCADSNHPNGNGVLNMSVSSTGAIHITGQLPNSILANTYHGTPISGYYMYTISCAPLRAMKDQRVIINFKELPTNTDTKSTIIQNYTVPSGTIQMDGVGTRSWSTTSTTYGGDALTGVLFRNTTTCNATVPSAMINETQNPDPYGDYGYDVYTNINVTCQNPAVDVYLKQVNPKYQYTPRGMRFSFVVIPTECTKGESAVCEQYTIDNKDIYTWYTSEGPGHSSGDYNHGCAYDGPINKDPERKLLGFKIQGAGPTINDPSYDIVTCITGITPGTYSTTIPMVIQIK